MNAPTQYQQRQRRQRQGTPRRGGTRSHSRHPLPVRMIRAYVRRWKRGNRQQRRRQAAITLVALCCVIALVAALVQVVRYHIAVTAARSNQAALSALYDFNPGNIIDDAHFFNPDAMTRDEVQQFLDDHVSQGCSEGQCLNTMTFDTTDQPADDYCNAYAGGTGQRAADIIDGAARACGVSQQVLLTMLQKEQQLISTVNPSDFQLKAAMGLSCPDNDHCDPQYAGFFQQVYGSAKRYQYYRVHEDQYGYHARRLNYVAYNPDPSCGGDTIYIENDATALLYIYTPYQPNTAALKAGAGTGDSCSTYGNRNFALIYTGWFGSAHN